MVGEQKTHKPRVMIFVESDNGFGHFNVVDQIASQISAKGGEVAMVSGTFFHPGAVFDYGGANKYPLPPVGWDRERSVSINIHTRAPYADEPHTRELRKAEVRTACEKFDPDIIIFELYPFMMHYRDDDIDAIRDFYSSHSAKPPIACLSRDIIHSAHPNRTVQVINDKFDHFLVRGDGVLRKVTDCQPEFKNIKLPMEYLGNVVSPVPPREQMDDLERPVVVFSGGGYINNAAEKNFFESAISSRKHSKSFNNNKWVIIVSNNCPEDKFLEYQALAQKEAPDGSISVVKPFKNAEFQKMLSNSAAAVVRGSYNTTFELAEAGVPFVVIPREHDREQPERADALMRAGLATRLLQKDLNPQSLGWELDLAKVTRATSLVKLNFNGAQRIADRVIELATERRQKLEAVPGATVHDAIGTPVLETDRNPGRE